MNNVFLNTLSLTFLSGQLISTTNLPIGPKSVNSNLVWIYVVTFTLGEMVTNMESYHFSIRYIFI